MHRTLFAAALVTLPFAARAGAAPPYAAELVFPLHPQHNHAPGIVECPNGDLLVSWYRGSGERRADDVAVYGARRRKGADDVERAVPARRHAGLPRLQHGPVRRRARTGCGSSGRRSSPTTGSRA